MGTGKARNIPTVFTEELSIPVRCHFSKPRTCWAAAPGIGEPAPHIDVCLLVSFSVCCGAGVQNLQGRTCGGQRLVSGDASFWPQPQCFITSDFRATGSKVAKQDCIFWFVGRTVELIHSFQCWCFLGNTYMSGFVCSVHSFYPCGLVNIPGLEKTQGHRDVSSASSPANIQRAYFNALGLFSFSQVRNSLSLFLSLTHLQTFLSFIFIFLYPIL